MASGLGGVIPPFKSGRDMGIMPVTPVEDRGLENMPKIRDAKGKAFRQAKMVEQLRKGNGKVAPRNRHAFKLAAMKRKSMSGKPKLGKNMASGTIG